MEELYLISYLHYCTLEASIQLDIIAVGTLIKSECKESFWSNYCTVWTILFRIHLIVHQEICFWFWCDRKRV